MTHYVRDVYITTSLLLIFTHYYNCHFCLLLHVITKPIITLLLHIFTLLLPVITLLIITYYYIAYYYPLLLHYYFIITSLCKHENSCNNGFIITYYYIGLFHYYIIITHYVIISHYYLLLTGQLADGLGICCNIWARGSGRTSTSQR